MGLKWPTWEEFVAGNLETRAVSDERGGTVVQEDAWQTNVMFRISSYEGQYLDLEPMTMWYEGGEVIRELGVERAQEMNKKNGF